jgi:hypothetical protein
MAAIFKMAAEGLNNNKKRSKKQEVPKTSFGDLIIITKIAIAKQ